MVTLLDGITSAESPNRMLDPHPIFLTAPASSEFTTPSHIFLSRPVRRAWPCSLFTSRPSIKYPLYHPWIWLYSFFLCSLLVGCQADPLQHGHSYIPPICEVLY